MLSAWTTALSDIPPWGDSVTSSTPDRSTIRQSLPTEAANWSNAVVPGISPVLIKSIQAAPMRRSDPLLTRLTPLLPRGKGAGDPHPFLRKRAETGPSQNLKREAMLRRRRTRLRPFRHRDNRPCLVTSFALHSTSKIGKSAYRNLKHVATVPAMRSCKKYELCKPILCKIHHRLFQHGSGVVSTHNQGRSADKVRAICRQGELDEPIADNFRSLHRQLQHRGLGATTAPSSSGLVQWIHWKSMNTIS